MMTMKTPSFFRFSSIAISICCLYCMSAFAQTTWTLDQCIDYASSHSIDLMKQQEIIATDEVNVAMSRKSFLPTVTAQIDNSLSFNHQLISGIYPDLLTMFNAPSSSSMYALLAEIEISVPLYDGGHRKARIEHDEAQLHSSQLGKENIIINLKVAIAQAYLQVLYLKELADIMASHVTFYQDMQQRIEKMIRAGVGKEIDLKQNQSKLADARYQEVLIDNDIRDNTLRLAQLVGLENSDSLVLADSSLSTMMKLQQPSLHVLSESQQIDSHPMIASQQAMVKASATDIRLAKSKMMPQVSLFAGLGTTAMQFFDRTSRNRMYSIGRQMSEYFSPVIGLHVSIPIYSAGQISGNIRKAEHAQNLQQMVLESERQQLNATIQKAQNNIISAYQKYQATADVVEACKASVDATRYSYEAGRSTMHDVSQSNLAYQEAQKNLLQCQYEYLIACKVLNYYLIR